MTGRRTIFTFKPQNTIINSPPKKEVLSSNNSIDEITQNRIQVPTIIKQTPTVSTKVITQEPVVITRAPQVSNKQGVSFEDVEHQLDNLLSTLKAPAKEASTPAKTPCESKNENNGGKSYTPFGKVEVQIEGVQGNPVQKARVARQIKNQIDNSRKNALLQEFSLFRFI